MARILALDTTGATAGIVLLDGDRTVVERVIAPSDGHSHVLFDPLREALAAASWTLADVDCFAAAAGPGSFTGVRVGLGTVKGLAEVAGRPVVAVSTLAALAWYGSGDRRAPVMDAGRGEVYAAVYDAAGALVAAEVIAPAVDWLSAPERVADAGGPVARGVGAIAMREFLAGRAVDPVAIDANYIRRPAAEVNFRRSFALESASPVNAGPRDPSHE